MPPADLGIARLLTPLNSPLEKALEEEKLKEPVEKVSEAMSSDYFGFKEGADISKETSKVPEVPAESPLTAVEDTAEIPEGIKEEKK